MKYSTTGASGLNENFAMKVFRVILICCWIITAHGISSAQDSAKISEISLEMVQGRIEFGNRLGRAFKVILSREGTASFEGKANVKLIGKYRGRISKEEFDNLADSLISKKYSQIDNDLPFRMSKAAGIETITFYDSPVVITSVTHDGKQKVIRRLTIVDSNYKKSIPKEITEIEKAITDAAMGIRWEKIDK
jgi:hypothetical protein